MEKIRHHSDHQLFEEVNVIRAIKDKIKRITDGDFTEPVYLKNVSVIDTNCSAGDSSVLCVVNSIFCDGAGTLCADLIGETNQFNTGIMFGQSIEELSLDDLKNILDALNDENWSVILNNGIEKRNKKAGSLQKLLKKQRNIARGA